MCVQQVLHCCSSAEARNLEKGKGCKLAVLGSEACALVETEVDGITVGCTEG